MADKSKLNKTERDILRYLDRVGFASTQCVQIAVGRNRFTVNTALQTLYKMGFIDRVKHGVAFSQKWLDRHESETRRINDYLGLTLTSKGYIAQSYER